MRGIIDLIKLFLRCVYHFAVILHQFPRAIIIVFSAYKEHRHFQFSNRLSVIEVIQLFSKGQSLLLEDACARQGLSIVHGAIQGWLVQATVARPGAGTLHQLYGPDFRPESASSLPFTPAFCAAVQAAEAVKLLCGRPSQLDGRLLLADLRQMSWELVRL